MSKTMRTRSSLIIGLTFIFFLCVGKVTAVTTVTFSDGINLNLTTGSTVTVTGIPVSGTGIQVPGGVVDESFTLISTGSNNSGIILNARSPQSHLEIFSLSVNQEQQIDIDDDFSKDVTLKITAVSKNTATITLTEIPQTYIVPIDAGGVSSFGMTIPAGALDTNDSLLQSVDTTPPAASGGMELFGIAINITLGSGKTEFNKAVTLKFTVNLAQINSRLSGKSVSLVKLAYFNGVRWVVIADSSLTGNEVTAKVAHLTKFAVVITSPQTDFSNILVYPNPFNPTMASHASAGITFDGITENSTIRIYDVSGALIKTISPGTSANQGNGVATWNGKNEDNDDVGMGLYIYVITDTAGRKAKGKIGIQR